jgi:hypothetical protein
MDHCGDGPRFGLIVHHTDAKREWAYDRESHIGRLDKALDLAPSWGTTGRRFFPRRTDPR